MRRLDSLTSLRFFAAAGVVAYHLGLLFHAPRSFTAFLGPGFVGVTFFFVLSGFVLTWSRQEVPARRFYRNRFARIWPTHGLVALLALVLPISGWSVVGLTVLLVQAWVPQPRYYFGLNAVAWTLSCEAFFYAAFPLLHAALRRIARPAAALLGLLTMYLLVGALIYGSLPSGTSFYLLYVCPLYRIGEFLLGMLLALVLQKGWRPKVAPALALAALATGLVGVSLIRPLSAAPPNSPVFWLYDAAVLPGVLLLIAFTASRDVAGHRGLLTRPALVRLGEWSFALYISHLVLIRILVVHVPNRTAGALLALVAVLPVAAVLHELWERPIEQRLRGLRASAAQPYSREELSRVPPQEAASAAGRVAREAGHRGS